MALVPQPAKKVISLVKAILIWEIRLRGRGREIESQLKNTFPIYRTWGSIRQH